MGSSSGYHTVATVFPCWDISQALIFLYFLRKILKTILFLFFNCRYLCDCVGLCIQLPQSSQWVSYAPKPELQAIVSRQHGCWEELGFSRVMSALNYYIISPGPNSFKYKNPLSSIIITQQRSRKCFDNYSLERLESQFNFFWQTSLWNNDLLINILYTKFIIKNRIVNTASMRPAWATKWVQGQPGLHIVRLSQNWKDYSKANSERTKTEDHSLIRSILKGLSINRRKTCGVLCYGFKTLSVQCPCSLSVTGAAVPKSSSTPLQFWLKQDPSNKSRLLPTLGVLFPFLFLRHGLSMQPWLAWNLLGRPGQPQTHRDPAASVSKCWGYRRVPPCLAVTHTEERVKGTVVHMGIYLSKGTKDTKTLECKARSYQAGEWWQIWGRNSWKDTEIEQSQLKIA